MVSSRRGPEVATGVEGRAVAVVEHGQIAKRNGASWSALGSGVDWDVQALAVFDDGSGPALHVGGAFVVSPAGDSRLAKWGCGERVQRADW